MTVGYTGKGSGFRRLNDAYWAQAFAARDDKPVNLKTLIDPATRKRDVAAYDEMVRNRPLEPISRCRGRHA